MRSMSSALAVAVRRGTGTPIVRVRARDSFGSAPRLQFAGPPVYQGSEPDAPHGAGAFTDGSLLRAYRASATTVRWQRVVAPGPGSAWNIWTTASMDSGAWCAVATDGSVGVIVADDGATVRAMTLADHGATTSGWTTVASASGALAGVAAAQRSNGDRAAFWIDGLTLRAARQSGGGWTTPSSSPLAMASVSGLSATWDNDWIVAVTGTDPSGRGTIWACRWGDDGALPAGVWETPRVVTTADAGTGTEYRTPFVLAGQIAGQPLRLTYTERFTGTPPWSATMTTHQYPFANFFNAVWREGWPLPVQSAHGVALAIAPTTMWLSRPGEVWQAPTPSLFGTDVSGRVVSARWEERAGLGQAFGVGRCAVELANPDGALTATITPGGSLEIAAGYRVGAADEYPGPPWATYWVEEVVARQSPTNGATIMARGVDVVGLLARWQAPRQSVWNGTRSVAVLIGQIAGWAGLDYNPRDPSPAVVTTTPRFTLPSGETALSAIQRLFGLVPDALLADGALLSSRPPALTDPIAATYGPDDHPIRAIALRRRIPDRSFARVIGAIGRGHAVDPTAAAIAGDSGAIIVERAITTAAEAQRRAEHALRSGLADADVIQIDGPPHVGLEPLDDVTVNAPRLGLTNARRRVLTVTTTMDRNAPIPFTQRVTLTRP